MKNLSRFFLLCMACCYLMVSFAGCSGEPKSPASQTESEASHITENESSFPATDVSSEEPNGSETTGSASQTSSTSQRTNSTSSKTNSSSNPSSNGPLFKERVTFSLLLMEHVNQLIKPDSIKFKAITEKTNVKLDIDVTAASSWHTKINSVLASGRMYDITVLNHTYIGQYSTDLYLDITPYYNQGKMPNYKSYYESDSTAKLTNIGGKMLGLCSFTEPSATAENVLGLLPVIRKDLLDEVNRPIPKTWEEWFNTMKLLKQKYPNSTPWSGRGKRLVYQNVEYQLGLQGDLHYDSHQGKYVIGALDSRYQQVLAFIRKCYVEGILDPKFDQTSTNTWNDGVLNNRIFFWIDNNGFGKIQTEELKKSNPKANMEAMPLMTGLFGEKRGLVYPQNAVYNMFVLNKRTKEPDKLIAFMDWCYSQEGININNYGREGETFTVGNDGSVKLTDSIIKKYRGSTNGYKWQSDLGLGLLCFSPVVGSKVDFTAAIQGKDTAPDTHYPIMKADLQAKNLRDSVDFFPYVSTDLSQKITEINDYIRIEGMKFIKGERNYQTEFNAFQNFVKNNLKAQSVVDQLNKVKG